MGETETVKLTVKAVIPLHDSGLRKLMREYILYKRILMPRLDRSSRTKASKFTLSRNYI
jgi:hypothetical protein